MSPEQLAVDDFGWYRDMKMGVDVAECAANGGKTLVFVGAMHAFRSLASKQPDAIINAFSAAQILMHKRRVSTLLLAQDTSSSSGPFYLPGLLEAEKTLVGNILTTRDDIPSKLKKFFKMEEDDHEIDSTIFFDYYDFGPQSAEIADDQTN